MNTNPESSSAGDDSAKHLEECFRLPAATGDRYVKPEALVKYVPSRHAIELVQQLEKYREADDRPIGASDPNGNPW